MWNRIYISRLDISSPSEHHTTNDESVLDLLDRIRETTDRDHGVTLPEPLVSSGDSPGGLTSPASDGGPYASGGVTSPVLDGGTGTADRDAISGPGIPRTSTNAPSARTLRELRTLAYYTNVVLPDVAHQDEFVNLVEYIYAANNTQLESWSKGEKVILIPYTFKEEMGLTETQ